jgi:histone deacetylase complex regulatory component SIN3
MKRRVDEIQTFHNTARAGGTAAIHHRITTPPQNINNSPNANQYHILNVLKDQPGTMVAPGTNIQYTYTHTPAIQNATSIPKNNVTQAAPSQVHVVNTASVNLTNSVRQKPSGAVTPTPHSSVTTSPGGAGASPANAQAVSGQNFPRLKVEDALSYLDQVSARFLALLKVKLTNNFVFSGEIQIWKSTASVQ